jgi:hypothetical protein
MINGTQLGTIFDIVICKHLDCKFHLLCHHTRPHLPKVVGYDTENRVVFCNDTKWGSTGASKPRNLCYCERIED